MKVFLMKPQQSLFILLFSAGISCSGWAQSEQNLRTPAEVLTAMEKSTISYIIDSNIDSTKLPAPVVLENTYFLQQDKQGIKLAKYTSSSFGISILNEAEEYFKKKDYRSAIGKYKELYDKQPNYFQALTYIGDCYYQLSDFDSASYYFKQAIDKNFIDYQAHWYLSDCYVYLKKPDESVREMITAHLLNINHKYMNLILQSRVKKINREWKPWTFRPIYLLSKDGNKVNIETTVEWLTYAMTKACWKYEPGFAVGVNEQLGDIKSTDLTEEKEAILGFLNDDKKVAILKPIIEDGYINEFIMYEIIAPQNPTILPLLPKKNFDRVIDYVMKYH